MKKRVFWMIAMLCAVAQGIWAQNSVSTETGLTDAIANGDTNIQLAGDILLSNYLNIEGKTLTIDLNGHKLYRNHTEHSGQGHVIYVHKNSTLTLKSSIAGGSIEGGRANNGGAINITHGSTVSATNVIFQNNSAADHAGAIWNNGTFTAENCVFENNRASDVGAIYNAVRTEDNVTYAGTATLKGCTFTRNRGIAGAGALANALGATVMTIEDCTIENNSAYQYGAGIWNGGTLNMKGAVKVTGNKNDDNVVSNLYLKSGKVVTLTGAITGSNIGVEMESVSGRFTSGYNTHHNGVDPANFFSADRLNVVSLGLDDNGEAGLFGNLFVNYIERSWDSTHEKVASIEKNLKGVMIGYDATPVEGQYKEVTNAPESSPNEWFGMGGYSDNVAEFYVVEGNVNRETIVVQGKDVHLILCDDATLTLTGGLRLEEDNKLYIHCQSYGDKMGRLMVANKYENAAGIGSAVDEEGNENTVGELVIHGGHIEATGGKYAAGIGSCKRTKDESLELCKSITVYGGYVKATGGKEGAGIGVGRYNNYFHSAGGDFYLYDGTVLALGGESASGVGGGGRCPGINVTVYGGSLTALGGEDGAGIGSGSDYHGGMYGTQCGGTCTIFGGTVTAIGGKRAAGIGGGKLCGGAEVNISGGRVMASGGIYGAGIGGGLYGFGGVVTISGGTVSATGGEDASGIGGGYKGKGGDVNITGGTVIAQTTDGAYGPGSAIGEGADSYKGMGELYIGDAMMVGAGNNGSVESILDAAERVDGCWFRTYAEISPCTHPSGFTYTINDGDTHTSHCKHCAVSETAEHFNGDGSGTCVCGYKDGEEYHTITIATSSNETYYEGVGVVANVGNNKPYTLPVCSTFPDGYDFVGWVVNPVSQENVIQPNEGETLLQAGENITITADVSIFARYQPLTISLADGSDNGEKLYTYNGRTNATVTLTGRTLWKDGDWNTLCLPFELTSLEGTPLAGATIKTLESSEFDSSNGELTLNFSESNLTAIEAGKPYIVKWVNASGSVSNPEFHNVTISNVLTPLVGDVVTFAGCYSPVNIGADGDNTLLYLGGGSTLYYPSTTMSIGSCRAIFQLNGIEAGDPADPQSVSVRAFKFNFGDDATGILSTTNLTNYTNSVYDLQGRKIDNRKSVNRELPKGVYIYKGKKVVIK